MTKASAKRKSPVPPSAPHPPIFYSLHALLHTVRLIQSHEDQLCTLLHEIQTSGRPSRKLLMELRQAIEELPSAEYESDLRAVRDALGDGPAPARPARKAPAKTPKKAARPGAKRPTKPPIKSARKRPTKGQSKAAARLASRRTRRA